MNLIEIKENESENMKIDIISLKCADDNWNTRLKQIPEGHLYQTTWWADYIKNYIKADPIFILAKNEQGIVVGQLLLFKEGFAQRLFFEKPFAKITVKLLKKIFPVYNWFYGPVIFDKDNELDVLSAMLNYLDKSIINNAKINEVNYPLHGNLNNEFISEVFSKFGYKTKSWATFLIDLKLSLEELRNNLKKTGRKAIERCGEQGIVVKRITDKRDLRKYYDILVDAKSKSGHKVTSFANIDQIWKYLVPNNAIDVFIAYYNDKPISGIITLTFNDVINEMGVAHSNFAVENKLYAQDLIKWEIIKWGHDKGHRVYDLTGVNPNAQTLKEKGIFQFKEKWGGKFIIYSVYSKNI